MTIEYLSSKRIQGVTGDTKPTNVPTGTEFMNTQTRVLSVFNGTTWDDVSGGGGGGGTLDSLTNVTVPTPSNNDVLTYNSGSSEWVSAAPPGASGGEANTTSTVGTGEGTLTKTKVGVDLPFKSLKQGTNVTLTNNTNDVTITSAYPPDATTTVKGIAELATDGENAANVVVQGNDSRLSNSRTPTTHKSSHVSGGSDTFAKGDDLVAAARYLEDVADPASDAQRIWIEDATANLKYWSDEGSPVKHTVATASSTTTFTNKTYDADGTGNSITNIENADIKAAAGITYSKLNLTGGIVNADVNASAGITTSKLADNSNFILKTLDNSFGAHYQDFTKMTAPSNPGANDIRLYVDTSDTHIKVKNSAGTVTDLQTVNSFTASSTDTLTNKTINPTSNILPYLTSFTYTIYQDGGAVKARNNKTGVITSNNNIDPLVTTILASGDPVVEIQTGNYNLSGGFSGWNITTDTHIFMHRGVWLFVPNAYAGDVFKFSPSTTDIFGAKIIGGSVIETATATNDWTCFAFKPTSGHGVVKCEIKDTQVWRCKYIFHFNSTDLSWGSDNVFDNIEGELCENFAKYDHTGTWTADASGFHTSMFRNCYLQGGSASGGNPQVQGGILNVMGDNHMFINCNMWDFHHNSSAATMTIHANGRGTQIVGGMLTHQNFSDAGTLTKRSDRHSGTVHKGAANYYDNITVTDPTNTASNGLLTLKKSNPTATDFLDWGINFEGRSSTLAEKIWARFICATDNYTEGSEDTWFGVEYRIGGTLAPRGLFYNNGIGMGPSGTRAYINASGMTGNRTFTLPDSAGQITVNTAAQTLTNKTVGDLKENWQNKSTTYTLTTADYGIFLTGTSTYTVTLPAVGTSGAGRKFKFIKTGASGTVTIDGAGAETINGATTITITTQYQLVELVCDGSAWFSHRMAP